MNEFPHWRLMDSKHLKYLFKCFFHFPSSMNLLSSRVKMYRLFLMNILHVFVPTAQCSHMSRTFSKLGLVFLHFPSIQAPSSHNISRVWGIKSYTNLWKRKCENIRPYIEWKNVFFEMWEHRKAPAFQTPSRNYNCCQDINQLVLTCTADLKATQY